MMRSTFLGRVLFSPEAARFLAVGCSNFVVSFTIFRLALALPGTHSFKTGAAQLLSYGVGVLWSYFWNRRFTFRTSGPASRQFVRFVGLQVVLAVTSAVVIDAVAASGIVGASTAWFLVMAVVTVVNFLACRLWVFRTDRKGPHVER